MREDVDLIGAEHKENVRAEADDVGVNGTPYENDAPPPPDDRRGPRGDVMVILWVEINGQ